jgi:DNA-binding response OmpR family regulator
MRNPEVSDNGLSALLLGDFGEDRPLVQAVFRKSGWRLIEASGSEAGECLEKHPVQVVLAEASLPRGGWKRVLARLQRLIPPPQLVVTSRTADDYLWAEVLNIGGFDVLARPFDTDEVERVVSAAWRHFSSQPARARFASSGGWYQVA